MRCVSCCLTRVELLYQANPHIAPYVFFYQTDITSQAALKQVADQIRKDHGDPTVLINNAGVASEGTILDKSDEKIRRTMEVNTLAHFWTVREFLPSMIKRDHGHIVTVASLASFVSFVEGVDYSCSKASALAFHEGLTQEIRYNYGARKVRTRCVPAIAALSIAKTTRLIDYQCYPSPLGSHSDD